MLKYYSSSFIFAALAGAAGYAMGSWAVAGIILVLGVLEVSLSFDNAVVNASVLKNWDKVWRDRFITWGLPIAVFGMRLVFPLMIVGIAAHLNPIEALTLAMSEPLKYEVILKSVHHEIAAFGSAFLMLVFLAFFIDEEKEHHWIGLPERALQAISHIPYISYVWTALSLIIASQFLDHSEVVAFLTAGAAGMGTYMGVQYLGSRLGGDEDDTSTKIIKQGVGGFMYLELLDASFSFDGVIAAFALTNQIFVIMLGLAVGAMFVRSMTIHLVETGTLSQFRYLEHGAFWAIGALAILMLLGAVVHVSELITGLIGAITIAASIWSSIKHNKNTVAPN